MITGPQLQSALDELYADRNALELDLKQVITAIDGLEALIQRKGGTVTTPPTRNTPQAEEKQSVGSAIDQILRGANDFVTVMEIKAGVANANPPVDVKGLSNAIYATLSRKARRGDYVKYNGKYRWGAVKKDF